MAKRKLTGSVSSGRTSREEGASMSKENRKEAKFWVSHRQGPYLFHDNSSSCEPQPEDNVGYLDDASTAIDQGFSPCSRCMKGE